jgi:hypothetical protein
MVSDICSSIMKWARCSGVTFAIERVKALKQLLIKGGDVPSGFARNRKGDLKGIFGSLIRWGRKSEKNFEKALQALMSYTYFILEKPTPQQKRKFRTAVSSDKPDNLSLEFHRDFALSLRRTFGMRQIKRDKGSNNLITYRGSDSRFRPGLSGLFPRSSTNSGIVDYITLFQVYSYRKIFKKYWSLFDPVFRGIDVSSYSNDMFIKDVSLDSRTRAMNYPATGGEVHFLMQEGGKMRSVASPHLIFQLALQPLGSSVYSIVQSLPWDCTFDQTKAVPFVQSALQQGSTVHSVDLSSATDHFPMTLQLSCLRSLFGNQPDIDLFLEISRLHWLTSEGDMIRWKRGQPLGLFPSFGTFTMTHGFLLWYLNNQSFNNDFFVLGDDVIILNNDLYCRYIDCLNTMSCPWSTEKSISSNKLGEFAGKLITSSSVIPMMKYKKLSNDNFLDICRLLGPRSRILLSKPQMKVYDDVCHLLPPFGLNFSYPGSNYSKMWEETQRMIKPSVAVVASLMGLSSVVRKNIYGKRIVQNVPVNLENLLELLSTFDEKVVEALQSLVPWEFWKRFQGSPILEGYAGVPSAVGNDTVLPLKSNPLRITTLKRYQALLAHRV